MNRSQSLSHRNGSKGKTGDDQEPTVVEPMTDSSKDKQTTRISLRHRFLLGLESRTVTLLMTIATIFAVYGDDTKTLSFEQSADHVFVALSSTCFFLFLIEMLVQCWCRDRYLKITPCNLRGNTRVQGKNRASQVKTLFSLLTIGSFYFWLDLLSTVSMLLELSWFSSYTSDFTNSMGNARVGRISSVGAKATRMIRLVRMVRLVRFLKLYKYISVSRRNKQNGSIIPEGIVKEDNEQSRVGAKMSDRTTKKVIVGILFMLVILPLLQVDDSSYFNEFGLHMVLDERASIASNVAQTSTSLIDGWLNSQNYFVNYTSCIQLTYDGFYDGQNTSASIPTNRRSSDAIRVEDKMVYRITNSYNSSQSVEAIFDISQDRKKVARMNVILTTFVIVLLVTGTMTFSRDVNNLVIIPIEKMVRMVREISANPLAKASSQIPAEIKGMDEGMETTVLLRTIAKIAGLMRIGFGEAGAEIICRNLDLSNYNVGGSAVTLLGSGTKIHSIFGFCDIRNFTDTTECLQEEVMLFVNRIAYILHSVVAQCDGAANKNIGDAFLMTWKLSEDKFASCEMHNYAGDKALYSFLKTMVEMVRNEDFIFNFSPSALGDLYERIPGYKCRIGCGLHFGWAIEGAIGSDNKIDVSYISPHVNWTEFLESSTKNYGVPILLSEPFFNLLSPEASKYCRQIDRIKKWSLDEPSGLFTYETHLENLMFQERITTSASGRRLRPSKRFSNASSRYSSRSSLMRRSMLSRRLTELYIHGPDQFMSRSLISPSYRSKNDIDEKTPVIRIPLFNVGLWESDEDIVNLRAMFPDKCRDLWNQGVHSYLTGNWSVALLYLDQVLLETNGADGPSIFLKQIINSCNDTAPHNWSGYRILYD